MLSLVFIFFFFTDTATTEIYTYLHTLSLHDALPIHAIQQQHPGLPVIILTANGTIPDAVKATQQGVFSYLVKPFEAKVLLGTLEKAVEQSGLRSEEHTSELQSLMRSSYAVFCLKKKKKRKQQQNQLYKNKYAT